MGFLKAGAAGLLAYLGIFVALILTPVLFLLMRGLVLASSGQLSSSCCG